MDQIKRSQSKSSLTSSESIHQVTYETPTCENEKEATYWRIELLQRIANTQGLVDVGFSQFETLKMFFDRDHWVVVMEAKGKP